MMKKVLIIGNGPSTKTLDFSKIDEIDTVGMNAAYRYWKKINFYPTYYCCLDNVVIISHQDEINKLIETNKIKKFFLHHNILNKYPELKKKDNVMIFYDNFQKNNKINIFNSKYVTTGSYSIRWMIHLGYKYIGIIGIDCNYVEIIEGAKKIDNNKSNILTIADNIKKNPNYFFDEYQIKGDKYNIPNNPNYKTTKNLHYNSIKQIDLDTKQSNIKIVNLSKNLKLFAFENIDTFIFNK